MPDDDDIEYEVYQPEPVIARSEELRELAKRIDQTKNAAARMRLIQVMDILIGEMRPKGEVRLLEDMRAR